MDKPSVAPDQARTLVVWELCIMWLAMLLLGLGCFGLMLLSVVLIARSLGDSS
jgi:hypothetical protein